VVVLMIASLALLPASLGATGEQLAALYGQSRTAILAGAVLGCLAWSSAFLVYVAALQQLLRARQNETTALLAGVGFAGGVVNAARTRDAALLTLAQDGSFLANSFTGYATAVCVGGFSPALRRAGFPSWLVVLGAAVGLHPLASTMSLAAEGFWSPSGPVTTTAPLGMTLWVGCVAALAWRRRDRM
jgi:hypothetical protein